MLTGVSWNFERSFHRLQQLYGILEICLFTTRLKSDWHVGRAVIFDRVAHGYLIICATSRLVST